MDVLIEKEVLAICFTGGEPLLAGRALYELVEKANRSGMYTSINTTARKSYTKHVMPEDAGRLKGAGLNSALVSLHGNTKEIHEEFVNCPTAFFHTLAGIKNMVKAGLNVTVNFVSTRKNVTQIVQTAQMLAGMGVKRMTVTPLLPYAGVETHNEWAMEKGQFRIYFDSLLEAEKKGLKVDSTLPIAPCILRDMFPDKFMEYLRVSSPRVCMAGVTFMVVSPEGTNRACIQAPNLDEYGGDVEKGFSDAWKKSSAWSEHYHLPQECIECAALACCGGGCRTSTLAENAKTGVNSISGKTMYMGQPLTVEEAKAFVTRIDQPSKGALSFRKKGGIRVRDEPFGGAVIANIPSQSFVVVEGAGAEAFRGMPEAFRVEKSQNGLDVLAAAGVLEPIANDASLPLFKQNVEVVHASELYPRLGSGLSGESVRMLRADTGERLFF